MAHFRTRTRTHAIYFSVRRMAALQLQALFRVHFKQEIINQKHKRAKKKKKVIPSWSWKGCLFTVRELEQKAKCHLIWPQLGPTQWWLRYFAALHIPLNAPESTVSIDNKFPKTSQLICLPLVKNKRRYQLQTAGMACRGSWWHSTSHHQLPQTGRRQLLTPSGKDTGNPKQEVWLLITQQEEGKVPSFSTNRKCHSSANEQLSSPELLSSNGFSFFPYWWLPFLFPPSLLQKFSCCVTPPVCLPDEMLPSSWIV